MEPAPGTGLKLAVAALALLAAGVLVWGFTAFDFEAGTITELFGEVNVTDAFDGADPVSLGDPVLAGRTDAVSHTAHCVGSRLYLGGNICPSLI